MLKLSCRRKKRGIVKTALFTVRCSARLGLFWAVTDMPQCPFVAGAMNPVKQGVVALGRGEEPQKRASLRVATFDTD